MTTRRVDSAWRPLGNAVAATLAATAASWLLPEDYAAVGVGFVFIAFTHWLVLASAPTETIRRHGLALGGLFEPEPLDGTRILRSALGALAWALVLGLIVLPPFWVGYRLWYDPMRPFSVDALAPVWSELPGQLLVVALPEEAFFRGYLQTALDDKWRPRWTLLGARLGPSAIVTSAVFAAGHVLTEPHLGRLAVFFPALLFSWLRVKTGGIGAPIAFHVLCNVFASTLGYGYGVTR